MSQDNIKFAYWVPNVSGRLVISKIEQRTSWDIDYNRKLAQIAEKAGFEYALSQIRFTAGYGAENQHESVTISHALLAATEKLKVIAAILPGPWSPVLAAKQLATIDQFTNGRVAVNIVSGWFKDEFRAIGEPWLEHDERYRRSEEFIQALKGIWTQDNFSFHGDFYRFHDFTLKHEVPLASVLGPSFPEDSPGILCRRKPEHPRIIPTELRRTFITDLEGRRHDALGIGHHQCSGLEQANPFLILQRAQTGDCLEVAVKCRNTH